MSMYNTVDMNGFGLTIGTDETDPEASEVLVNGEIGGFVYVFLLDTGAATSRVKSDDYTSAFVRIDQLHTNGVFSGNHHDLIVVPSLSLGPILETNFTLARTRKDAPDTKNLIGMDFLKNHSYYFHFDEDWVDVDPIDILADRFLRHDLIMGPKSHPYVSVSFGGVTARALWDSGAGVTIVDTQFIDEHPSLFKELGTSE